MNFYSSWRQGKSLCTNGDPSVDICCICNKEEYINIQLKVSLCG